MSKSPFPGMDPYLEGELWQEFHDTLIHQIRAQLLPRLRPNYIALLNKYYAVDTADIGIGAWNKKAFYPDVRVTTVKEAVAPYGTVTRPAVELINPLPVEVPILKVEIRDLAERRLVTVIEILSPANKRGKGFEAYVEKRISLLQTDTHLLEIDLLRGGQRLPLTGGELPPASYYVFLSRFNRRPRTEVWPVQLRDTLPTVPVPLLPPDPDVPLSLQKAVDDCFELVGYHDYLIDYTQPPPPPPLAETEAAWVATVVEKQNR